MAEPGQGGQGPRGMFWTGVLNNYTEDELKSLSQLDCPELVIAKETGHEGTPHLHIYLRFRSRQYLSHLKRISERAHWEVVRDRSACISYCEKDGDVVVERLLKKPSRPKLSDAVECLQSEGLAGVAREYPCQFVQYSRGLQALQYATIMTAEKPVPQVYWYWGPTGSGKTRLAYEEVNEFNIFFINAPNNKGGALWFDGYQGQEVAIFDDFRPWWCRFDYLLRLLDRYPMTVPVKGGFVNWIPQKIIITTQFNVEETFQEYRSSEDLLQIKRRITKVVEFKKLAGV